MNATTDTRSTRIAVFIDFDNVEIGVKSTIGGQFDIGLVLEAIKERGEIVTKIAYSDWKRAGDYSRLLTQHAIRMVQRNLTPGGDKNGADITMALDALEMAFTHDHINAFVIVGGDSDFISLVEKLKQYGRKVIVVGGRQFTSATMQRNCHEFIAYENLVGRGGGGRVAERGGRPVNATSDITKALPIVKRALKVLSEREVTPQLGLLKSTLLQLDSTFSEREYGASSFRDFMEKVAESGAVTLKQAGRSMLVESRDDGPSIEVVMSAAEKVVERPEPRDRSEMPVRLPPPAPPVMAQPPVADGDADEEQMPASPMSPQDGIRAVHQALNQAEPPPRWPMYVRQAKQFLRTAIDGFDERKYGFASVVDLLRAAGKEGVVRIERDRQGAVRVFPGANTPARPVAPLVAESMVDGEEVIEGDTSIDASSEQVTTGDVIGNVTVIATESVEESPIVDGEPMDPADVAAARIAGQIGGGGERPKPGARKRKTVAPPPQRATKATRTTKAAAAPRGRKSTRAKSPAAGK